MAVISVRFNEKESKILNRLSQELEMDKSALIKRSLMDTYEDLIDRGVIDGFEKSSKKHPPKFLSFEQITKS